MTELNLFLSDEDLARLFTIKDKMDDPAKKEMSGNEFAQYLLQRYLRELHPKTAEYTGETGDKEDPEKRKKAAEELREILRSREATAINGCVEELFVTTETYAVSITDDGYVDRFLYEDDPNMLWDEPYARGTVNVYELLTLMKMGLSLNEAIARIDRLS